MADVFLPGMLKQRAVYWAPLGLDSSTSVMKFDEPVEVRCRWTDTAVHYVRPNAELSVSKSMVMVDRDMDVGGIMWQGKLEDLDDPDEPNNNDGAVIIDGFNKVPLITPTKFVRTAICID